MIAEQLHIGGVTLKEGFFSRVYEVLISVPAGKVISYGKLAEMCGNKKMARQVGWALHVNPKPGEIPCHRVVTKDGRVSKAFAFGGENAQIALLVKEGIVFDDSGCVPKKYYI